MAEQRDLEQDDWTDEVEDVEEWDDTPTEDEIEERHGELLADLRQKHQRIAYWWVPRVGLVVAARPKKKEYQRYINLMNNEDADTAVTIENFAVKCVVHPTELDLVKCIFDENPALANTVSKRVSDLCGGSIRELGKRSKKRGRTS